MTNIIKLVEVPEVSDLLHDTADEIETGAYGRVNAIVIIMQTDIGGVLVTGGDADQYKALFMLEEAKAEILS